MREPACAAFLVRQAGGCPPRDRLALCKAYIAKAVWDFATTRNLIDLSACVHAQAGGPVKVAAHLDFGLVVIAAEQMLRMLA